MRHVALALLLTLVGKAVWADSTDSGAFQVDGQAVIGGTATVRGSAFSVGGSTFTIGGGSITLGGLLNAAAAGIRWADGTTSTTAAGGGGGAGDMLLSSTQTVSAAKTFTSSITVGPTVYTTTATTGPGATVAAGQLVNSWMIVASTHPTGASSIHFTGLQAGKFYRVHYRLRRATAGRTRIIFNGDTGSSYKWYVNGFITVTGGASNSTGDPDTHIAFTYIDTRDATDEIGGFTFTTSPSDDTIVGVFNCSVLRWKSSTNQFEPFDCGGYYDGSSGLSSMTFTVSAGTLTGYVYLEQMIAPLP